MDHRLSNSATGEFIDENAVKFLSVHYPGDMKAILAHTGIAQLKDGVPSAAATS